MDVLAERAFRDGEGVTQLLRIGIEIETGKSDVIGNVKNGLRSFRKLVIAAPSDVARTKIRAQLDAEGLLVPSRVLIVAANHCERDLDAFLDDRSSHGSSVRQDTRKHVERRRKET